MTVRMLFLALFIITLPILVGCGHSMSTTAKEIRVSKPSLPVNGDCGTTQDKDGQVADLKRIRNPVRIVFEQDKSQSANSTLTDQLTENDFTIPINVLRCVGGELAVGVVDNVSKKSLARLRVEVPPSPPSSPDASNVFVRANQDAAYQQRLNDYQSDVEKWAAETDKRVETFLAQVANLLKQPATAKRTSVWNAVARADLMLNESDVTWPQPTHRYAVLNSDCQETARTKPVQVKSSAQWIVVNGAGSVGVAEALKPERFENSTSAFEFIKAKELRGK